MTIQRNRQSRAQWQSIVQQQAASGEPARRWCEAHQVGYASFMKWRKKLRDERRAESVQPAFVELTSARQQPVSDNTASAWQVELELAPNITLRIAHPA